MQKDELLNGYLSSINKEKNMIYGLAVAVAVLGILVSILALATFDVADRLSKEADKSVKLAMKLMDIAGKNIKDKDLK